MIFGGQFTTVGGLTLRPVNTVPATIDIKMAGATQKNFYGLFPITAIKTWQLSNAASSLEFKFNFELTGLFAQTMPADFIMSDPLWNDALKKWQPLDIGEYQASAVYNGTNWVLSIVGPYA